MKGQKEGKRQGLDLNLGLLKLVLLSSALKGSSDTQGQPSVLASQDGQSEGLKRDMGLTDDKQVRAL